MLFGFLLSYKYHTQCWISYKSRESELSISMSFAAREVITPGQQEICNPYQLLAPRMPCFAGTLTYCLYQKAQLLHSCRGKVFVV